MRREIALIEVLCCADTSSAFIYESLTSKHRASQKQHTALSCSKEFWSISEDTTNMLLSSLIYRWYQVASVASLCVRSGV